MAIKKTILYKLMSLNNEKADTELAKYANELLGEVQSSNDNDAIFEKLDILKEFIYKVPATAIKIIQHVITNSYEAAIHKTDFGNISGKSHDDLLVKSVDLIDRLRYISTDEILPILAILIKNPNPKIRTKSTEVLKNLAKYDFTLLSKTNLGYTPQRKVLNFITAWSREEQQQNFDFIDTVAERLLSSSVEGLTGSSEAITFNFAAVKPSDELKQMRKEVIDFSYDFYKQLSNDEQRLKLIQLFDEAVRPPLHVAYGDDVAAMISENWKHIVDIYKDILFNKSGDLIAPLTVAQEIERRLFYISKNNSLNIPEVEKLRQSMLADRLYNLSRLLSGNDLIFREEQGWETSEKMRTDSIAEQVASINDGNLSGWIKDLNIIAASKGPRNEWQFLPFRQQFLKKLAITKPELAEKILNDAFEGHKPIVNFAHDFLNGFRVGNHLGLWDEFVNRLLAEKTPELVIAIPYSLMPDPGDTSAQLRPKDWELLENLIDQKAEFTFLKGRVKSEFGIHSSISRCLIEIYRLDPKKTEKLLVKEMVANPEYRNVYVLNMSFPVMKKFIDLATWDNESVKALKDLLIKFTDLDWHSQDLLLALGQLNPQNILDIFTGRMDHDQQRKADKNNYDLSDRYDAIPFEINHSLRAFVLADKYIREHVLDWANKVTVEWSSYNWNIGNFLERMGLSLREVIKPFIDKGDTDSLLKATFLIMPYEASMDLDLCVEIIGQTDDERIISQIRAQLFSTGVVSGEYGIAEAHERRATELERFLDDPNPRIKSFIDKAIKDLNLGAASAKQRADEEKKIRKIEFDE